MKLLIIAWNTGGSAAGIVVEQLVLEIFKQNPETQVICNFNLSDKLPHEKFHEIKHGLMRHNRIDKLFLTLTHIEWNGLLWVKKGLGVMQNLNPSFKPDVVLCFAAAYGFRIFDLAFKISKEYKIPLAIHAFDPLPSAPGWGEHPFLRKAIKSIILPYYRHATYISATNEIMLKYQFDVLKLDRNKKKEVILNPIIQNRAYAIGPAIEPKSILYLGSLYEKRNPQLVIDAFSLILEIETDCKLYFVGNNRCTNLIISEKDKDKIIFVNWTEKPEKYIQKAGILLDIDANIPNDVFISSKLNYYLQFDRPILSIRRDENPSAFFVKNLKESVVTTSINLTSIISGMKKILNIDSTKLDYQERNSIRKELLPETICKKLLDSINEMIQI